MDNKENHEEKIRKFYHVTKKEYVESILKSSLFPGKDIGKQNIYCGYWGDPSFISFFNESRARDISREIIIGEYPVDIWNQETHTLLELSLPPIHPVERDYDMLLYILNIPDATVFESSFGMTPTAWVELVFKEYSIEFTGPLSKENLVRHVDMIPGYVWECCMGYYRTTEPISGQNIRDVGFEYLIFIEVLMKAKGKEALMKNIMEKLIIE